MNHLVVDLEEWVRRLWEERNTSGDFTFFVGPAKVPIKVHKDVVFCCSLQLQGVIRGRRSADLPDVNPKAFLVILKVMYKLPFPEDLDMPTLLRVFHYGWNYELWESVVSKCQAKIKDMMTPQNVCDIYRWGIGLGAGELQNMALDYFKLHTQEVLDSDGILSVEMEYFKNLLTSSSCVDLPPLTLFNTVLRWGKRGAKGDTSLRSCVEDLLKFVPFQYMSAEEVADHVAPANILSSDELATIICFICASPSHKPSWPTFCRANDRLYQNSPVVETKSVACQTAPPMPGPEIRFRRDNAEVNQSQNTQSSFISDAVVPPMNLELQDGSFKSPNKRPLHVENDSPRRTRRRVDSPPSSVISSVFSSVITRRNYAGGNSAGLRDTRQTEINQGGCDGSDSSDEFEAVRLLSKRTTDRNLGVWEEYLRIWEKSSKGNVMKAITIRNCKVAGLLRRPFLPKLRELVVDMDIPENSVDKPNSFRRFMCSFDLRRFMFFKKEERDWEFTDLWDMDIIMELTINDTTLFKMNRKSKEVIVSFRNDSTEVLAAMVDIQTSEYLENLTIALTDFPPVGFSCQNLKTLRCYKVKDYFLSDAGPFLRKLRKLETLSLWPDRQKWDSSTRKGIQDKTPINLAMDLPSSNLRRLALYNVKIILNSEKEIDTSKKLHLAELYTRGCHWSPLIFQKFDELFPNLKRISVSKPFLSQYSCENSKEKSTKTKLYGAVMVQLLLKICNMKCMEYVRVIGMNWGKPSESKKGGAEEADKKSRRRSTRICRKKETDVAKEQATNEGVNALFQDTGLTPEIKNFLLEKNPITGKWKGYKLETLKEHADERYRREADEEFMEFEQLELNRMYRNFEAFQKCKFTDDVKSPDLSDEEDYDEYETISSNSSDLVSSIYIRE